MWGTLSRTIAARRSAALSARWFDAEQVRGDGVFFDDFRAYASPSGNPSFDLSRPFFWSAGHVFPSYIRHRSSFWELKAAAREAIRETHVFALGGELRFLTLRDYAADVRNVELAPDGTIAATNAAGYGYDAFGRGEVNGPDGARHARTWAAYAEDRFMLAKIVAEVGLRLERAEAGVAHLQVLSDSTGPIAVERWGVHGRTRFLPRFAIGITAAPGTRLRASAGRYLEAVDLRSQLATFEVPVGAPLRAPSEPEQATSLELGLLQELPASVTLDLAAWQRSTRGAGMWGFQFAREVTIRGVDLQAALARTRGLAASLSYTLSSTRGDPSVPNNSANPAWYSTPVPSISVPLDHDRRHALALDADYRVKDGEGPMLGSRHWLEKSGINLLARIASGTPYTPTLVYDEVTLAAVAPQPVGGPNERSGPWTVSIDVRATRELSLAGMPLEASVWVINLLDRRNANTVFTGSGSPSTTAWLATPDGKAWLQNAGPDGARLYDLAQSRPEFFDAPRLVRFGVRAKF